MTSRDIGGGRERRREPRSFGRGRVPQLSVRRQVIGTLLLVAAIALAQLSVGLHALSDTDFMLRRADTSYRQLAAYQRLSIDLLDAMRSTQAAATPARLVAERRAMVRTDLDRLDALVRVEVGLVREHGLTENDTAERRRLVSIRAVIGRLLATTPNGLDAIYEDDLAPLLSAAVAGEQAETEEVQQKMAALQTRMRRLGPLGVLMQVATAALVAVLVGRRVLDPLAALVADIRVLGRGTLGHRVETRRRDEFGLLARHINRMACQLERRRRLLVAGNDRLERTVAERTLALSESNAELRDIDASRRRFFADVSHELRTPLTAIVGEADVTLRIAGTAVPAYRDALSSILANSTYLNRRIDDLTALARSLDGQLALDRRPVDLDLVASEALAEIGSLARINEVSVRLAASDEALPIRGDRVRLRQSVMILLDNAVKFSHGGSEVVLALERGGDRARISVIDRGRGIAVEDLPNVFERFYQTDLGKRCGGTGLGLAIARRIAEAHEGSVTATRNADGGTCVTLDLPLDEMAIA